MKKALNTSFAVGVLLLAGGTLAACGQAAPAGAPQLRTHGAQINAATVDTSGHAWARSGSGAVEITDDSGQTWRTVKLPAQAASGHSVAVQGNLIAAVTVAGDGLAVQRSTDQGATWRSSAIQAPTGAADIAVSADGRHVAVMAELPDGQANAGTPDLYVGGAQGDLIARSAPAGGDVAWLGGRLLLTGGPLHSQLFSSDDNGATWTQRSVDGAEAPRFNVSPDVAGIGTPVPSASGDGTELVPLTEHKGGSSVVVYSTTDGLSFTAGPAVALSGQAGPGVTAVVSAAGPGQYVVVDPASNALHVVRGAQQSVVRPAGLTGPIDALTFQDAQHGIAEVAQSTGCADKATCDTTEVSFRTVDGGHTWQLATR